MTHEPPYPYDWMRGYHPPPYITLPPPRFVPVNMQVPDCGVTVATLDPAGNLTVKVNQPAPVSESVE